jgi:hypothetical protein
MERAMTDTNATNEENSKEKEARDIVASVFTGAANTAAAIAPFVPEPVKSGLLIGSTIASIVGSLIGSIGGEQTKKLVEELQRRRNEGTISDKMLAEDDAYIRSTVSELYNKTT